MFKRLIFAFLAIGFCMAPTIKAANIIWVSENIDNNTDGIQDDYRWVEWLEGQGISLDVQRGNWTTLDAGKISTLNAADLIIVSRGANSGSYDEEGESTQWNSITTPIISTNMYFARSSRWLWMNTTTFSRDNVGSPVLEAVELIHPVFFGITFDEANRVVILDDTVGSANNAFLSSIDVGNGKLIAKVASQDWTWIAEWDPGVEFYSGSGQFAEGRRLLFCAGTQETTNVAQGEFNLNENGQKMFLNAINYMLGKSLRQVQAHDPYPVDTASNIEQKVVLSWSPGEFADKHNVYFGTEFDDVNNADVDNQLDVLDSLGQDANTYDPGPLKLGTKYYWRADEVNVPSSPGIYKGDIWSFTVEKVAYPIPGDVILAIASGQAAADQGPENTINGSGLNDDLHSSKLTDMWLSASGEPGSAWIKYEFDKVYMLHEMWVWNYNGPSLLAVLGLKDVTIEYSTDGDIWTQLGENIQLPRATGMDDYATDININFGNVLAKYVKITANSNQGGGGFFNQYGLSEVRFYAIPNSARNPSPDNGTSDIPLDVTLSWRSGRGAEKHNVYISDDEQAVTDGTAPMVTVSQTNYGPLSLNLGTIYYWRIDEVSDVTWPGDIWNFSTEQYINVEDFESYTDNDTAGQAIWQTWTDGYEVPANGSTIGYPNPDFLSGEHYMETTIRHGGMQSAPVLYDNSIATYSEVTVNINDLPIERNWTIGSPLMLSLWYYGDAGNSTTDQMYVKLNNNAKVPYNAVLTQAGWQQLTIDLVDFGIELNNITSLTIGFERTGATGGSGIVLIDDIQLYTPVE